MPDKTSIYAYLEKPSLVDFPKHFAAVFFVSGCNFACGFCHNAPLMGKRQEGLSWRKLETVCARFRKEWVNSAVITGGEPTCAPELPALIRCFKEKFGFAVKLDTNGANPQQLAECLPLADYVAMDIKCSLGTYPGLAGFADTARILESIDLIRTRARDYEFRTTVIETVHSDEEMKGIAEIVSGSKRYVLQPFIPRDNLPGEHYRRLPRTGTARLRELKTLMHGCAGEIILRGA